MADDNVIRSTLTTVTVLETYLGAPASTLTIRQSGSESLVFDGLAELLTPGDEYILYLKPFSFDERPNADEWIPTGEVGVYRLADGEYQRTAADATSLPRTVDPAAPLGSGGPSASVTQ
jgi:hypothetical protein